MNMVGTMNELRTIVTVSFGTPGTLNKITTWRFINQESLGNNSGWCFLKDQSQHKKTQLQPFRSHRMGWRFLSQDDVLYSGWLFSGWFKQKNRYQLDNHGWFYPFRIANGVRKWVLPHEPRPNWQSNMKAVVSWSMFWCGMALVWWRYHGIGFSVSAGLGQSLAWLISTWSSHTSLAFRGRCVAASTVSMPFVQFWWSTPNHFFGSLNWFKREKHSCNLAVWTKNIWPPIKRPAESVY